MLVVFLVVRVNILLFESVQFFGGSGIIPVAPFGAILSFAPSPHTLVVSFSSSFANELCAMAPDCAIAGPFSCLLVVEQRRRFRGVQ